MGARKSRESAGAQGNLRLVRSGRGDGTAPFRARISVDGCQSGRAGFDGGSFFVPDGLSPDETAAALKEVYRSIAKDYLVKRTYELADSFGETVASVKINSARARWGSCTSKRNINLSLFLVMAPEGAVDYCIIHELSHLKYMDHSAAFWRLVASRCPDYEERREELKALNSRLVREKW